MASKKKVIKPLLRVSYRSRAALSSSRPFHEDFQPHITASHLQRTLDPLIGALASRVTICPFPRTVRRPGQGFYGEPVYRSRAAVADVRRQPEHEDEGLEEELIRIVSGARLAKQAVIEVYSSLPHRYVGSESVPMGQCVVKLNPVTCDRIRRLEEEKKGLVIKQAKTVASEENFEELMIRLSGLVVWENTAEIGVSLLQAFHLVSKEGWEVALKKWKKKFKFSTPHTDVEKKRLVLMSLILIHERLRALASSPPPRSEDTSEGTPSSATDPTPTPTPAPMPTSDATPPSPSTTPDPAPIPTPDVTPTPELPIPELPGDGGFWDALWSAVRSIFGM